MEKTRRLFSHELGARIAFLFCACVVISTSHYAILVIQMYNVMIFCMIDNFFLPFDMSPKGGIFLKTLLK